MKNNKFKMIGVYMNDMNEFNVVFNTFARAASQYTGYPISRLNKTAFMTYTKEVYAFVTTKDKIANNKFNTVFVDNAISNEIIDEFIKPKLIDKMDIYRY